MPGFLNWFRSTVRGEVSAAEIYVRRGAGTAAYSLADEAAAADGDDRGTRLFRVCAWNAFALQTIADTLIDADAANDPATAGYVPRSTLNFASDCVDCVPDWIRLARVVRSDPSARVRNLPARLPLWRSGEPTRTSELRGLRSAYETLEARVESDLQVLAATSPDHSRAIAHVQRVRAEMESAAEYADAIAVRDAGAVDRGEARWRLLSALENAFVLGQLIALPTLVDLARARENRGAESPLEESASWLQICADWPVLDSSGTMVGFVLRVRGDRDTGEFEGIDVGSSLEPTTVHVPPSSISAIDGEEVRLSVLEADLQR